MGERGGGNTGGGIAMKSESRLLFVDLGIVGLCLAGGGNIDFTGAGTLNEVFSFEGGGGGGPSPMYPDSRST